MKCLQCGAELNGNKFCTNCGAPAPQETEVKVCSNCGEKVEGKFCTKCGTPVDSSVQPEQNEANDANNVPEGTADAENQPVDYQNPYAPSAKPDKYSENANQNTYQQSTGYTGQQFTNKPNGASNGKKPMSGGKIAVIIVSIVLGLIIILGIIIGVVACDVFKKVINVAKETASSYDDGLSRDNDFLSSFLDNFDSDIYYDDSSSNSSSYTEYFDEATGFTFERSELYNGWAVVDYQTSDYDQSKITLEIPKQFKGEDVVEIKRLYVYDNDSTDKGYLKVIIPGTVKIIDEYSLSFLSDINEVVIEDGVEKIEDYAFISDNDLLKIHIPASVNDIDDDCGIGYDDNDRTLGKDFTIYGVKGSEAEKYAKEHKLNFATEDSQQTGTSAASKTEAVTSSKSN